MERYAAVAAASVQRKSWGGTDNAALSGGVNSIRLGRTRVIDPGDEQMRVNQLNQTASQPSR
jgi:hypothetical protein